MWSSSCVATYKHQHPHTGHSLCRQHRHAPVIIVSRSNTQAPTPPYWTLSPLNVVLLLNVPVFENCFWIHCYCDHEDSIGTHLWSSSCVATQAWRPLSRSCTGGMAWPATSTTCVGGTLCEKVRDRARSSCYALYNRCRHGLRTGPTQLTPVLSACFIKSGWEVHNVF